MANQLDRRWIVHLELKRNHVVHSDYSEVSNDYLTGLVSNQLGLPPLHLRALEFLHGTITRPAQFSDWAPSLANRVLGTSYELALGVGAIGAAVGQSLDHDLLFSGAFQPRSLKLSPIPEIGKKLTLALGIGAGDPAIGALTRKMYRHLRTRDFLGLEADRTLPGEVKLFIAAADLPDRPPIDEVHGLRYEPLEQLTVDRVRQLSPEGRWKLAYNGVILAIISNLADALDLANLDWRQLDNLPAELLNRGGPEPRFYRVISTADGSTRLFGSQYWRDREAILTEVFRDRADQRSDLAGEPAERMADLNNVLSLLVDETNHHLGSQGKAFAGNIAVLGDRPNWLDVRARYNAADLPLRYPLSLVNTPRISAGAEFEEFNKTSYDKDFEKAIKTSRAEWRSYHEEEGGVRFEAHLQQAVDCIRLPIKGSGCDLAAMISLHINSPCEYPPGMIKELLVPLARLAKPAVDWWRGHYSTGFGELPKFTYAPSDLSSSQRQTEKLREVGSRVVLWACQSIPGVFRSSLRIVTPGRDTLWLAGAHGYDKNHPPAEETGLTEETAASFAASHGQTIWIEDTAEATFLDLDGQPLRVPYRVIEPNPGAVAVVVLRVDGHVLGVLNLDWEKPMAFSQAFRRSLEDAIGHLAQLLKSFLVDAEFNSLDEMFRVELNRLDHHQTVNVASVYERFLRAVAQMAGGQYAMLFLRDQATGRFKPVDFSLGHKPGWRDDEKLKEGFLLGEGLIGWVAKFNQVICVPNVRDEEALRQIDEQNPPKWYSVKWFQEEFGDLPVPYLAVPIVAGGEVCGVVRLINVNPAFRFDYEKVIVSNAAARLGQFLYRVQTDQIGATVWLERLRDVPTDSDQVQLAKHFLSLLPHSVGACEAGIRLSDRVILSTGQKVLALRRVASTAAMMDSAIFRLKGEAGVTVKVWESKEELIIQDTSDPGIRQLIGADRDPFVTKRCQDFPAVIGMPLHDQWEKLIGTIYVTRRGKDAFTDMEIRRIRAVAGLIGKELARMDNEDFLRIERNIQAEVFRLMHLGVQHRLASRHRVEFYPELLEEMRIYLGAETGRVFIRELDSQEGNDRQLNRLLARLSHEVEQHLTGGFRVVSYPAEDKALLPVFAWLATDHLADRQRAVFTLGTPGERLALFALAARPKEGLSVRRAERLQGLLGEQLPTLLRWIETWGKSS